MSADWLRNARAAADMPPAARRVPFGIAPAGATIGSIEPSLADRMRAAGLPVAASANGNWNCVGPADGALDDIARWLHAERVCPHWRGERLDVVGTDGAPVATIERGVVRALGITTFAVHLVGLTSDERVWIQQRAFDKATDPGGWDTLVGGLVAAGESIGTTLERETMEEAGLDVAALHDLRAAGHLSVRRPVAEGYMVEHIEVFRGVVPDGVEPVNRDGEVERFDCLDVAALVERLQAGAFTLEAALILGAQLERRGEP